MLTTENASSLTGGSMKQTEDVKMKVLITRAVRWEGDVVKPGEVMELTKQQATELVANGKATLDLKHKKVADDKPQTSTK